MRNQTILCIMLSPLACKARGPETTSAALSEEVSELAPAAPMNLDKYVCPATDKVKVAFFDADSTLRVSKIYSVSANGPKDVAILPFVGPKIGELNQQGFLVAIVSNQLGIQQKKVEEGVARAALMYTASQIGRLGGRIDWIGYAPADDENRKPGIGMANQVIAAVKAKCQKDVDLGASFMVGDSGYTRGKDGPHPDGRPADDFSNADRGFAQNLFFLGEDSVDARHFQEPTDFFGWKDFRVYNVEHIGELEDFLLTIDAKGNDSQRKEAARLRDVNDMPRRS